MNYNTRSNGKDNKVIREFEYIKLSVDSTEKLRDAAIKMIDLHFNCDGEFEQKCKETDYYLEDPLEIFKRFESIFRPLCKMNSEADARFLDYLVNNTTTSFKWWKYNGECVNLSQAQLHWWKKQLTRYGMDSEFLSGTTTPPTTTSKPEVKPAFHELFE